MTSATPDSIGSGPEQSPPAEEQEASSQKLPVQGTNIADSANASQSASIAPLVTVARPNRRPQDVTALLLGGEVHSTWNFANRRAIRFYVINLEHVIGRLNLQHTRSQPYFAQAQKLIADETQWKLQHPFDYQCSHTQVFPDKIRAPKYFGAAATIIVAIEIAALERQPALNVYDYLRILPATFFADQFDRKRLDELTAFHATMDPEERARKFGAEFADRSFNETSVAKIEQERRLELLGQMAGGACVTKYVADKLTLFVNENYPERLHIGPVRSSGEDAITDGLGGKNAAGHLRVPRSLPRESLPPCF